MEGERGLVCVTGGTGFIASWLIMRLLQNGYKVQTTVRPDPEGKRDVSYLTNLPGAFERLQIFNADLDEPESFSDAIQGCIGVFHVAHPLAFNENEPEEIVSKRLVEATLGILRICLNSKTVKRVVYTSSSKAVLLCGKDVDVVDENVWSDVDYHKSLNTFGLHYMASKTKSEMAALAFGEEHGLDIVSLLPCRAVGPFLTPHLPASVEVALSMILGKKHLYKYLTNIHMVHVYDVARAHIFLFENPTAKGRYICASDEISINELSEFLSIKYPEYQIPTSDELKGNEGKKLPHLSSKKLLEAGFQFKYGLDEMLDGAIQSCKEKGFLYVGKKERFKYLEFVHKVQVDDLAGAYIFLLENPAANGRYICSSNEMSEFLPAKYPEYQTPTAE
ncbi:NAD-dependent epimerase/dehydratase [Dillenia turbinata]|uniref:NAD-dependent epimerase/dehydratase n=1 Tax=Dillenia turbinata TaxID=194707 RepID=A0AAN8V0C5_9MAGN